MTNDGVTVIYIAGLWRSGSTILDIILGSHRLVESVGELRNLPAGWIEGATCACGESAAACHFWSKVRADWEQRVGGDRVARLIALQDRFERLSALPALLANAFLRRSREMVEYGELLGALYTAIAQVSGKSIVVDSTKYPGRALAVTRIDGLNVRIIHLVRDGRAVIWSIRRKANTDKKGNEIVQDPADVARATTSSWLRVNLVCDFVRRIVSNATIRLRYEDLMADPRAELRRVGELAGLDFGEVADQLIGGHALPVAHTVAGNRVRHSGAIKLQPDLEWREKLPSGDREEFWRRAGWVARRYGYAK
jgi:hypothetical protein